MVMFVRRSNSLECSAGAIPDTTANRSSMKSRKMRMPTSRSAELKRKRGSVPESARAARRTPRTSQSDHPGNEARFAPRRCCARAAAAAWGHWSWPSASARSSPPSAGPRDGWLGFSVRRCCRRRRARLPPRPEGAEGGASAGRKAPAVAPPPPRRRGQLHAALQDVHGNDVRRMSYQEEAEGAAPGHRGGAAGALGDVGHDPLQMWHEGRSQMKVLQNDPGAEAPTFLDELGGALFFPSPERDDEHALVRVVLPRESHHGAHGICPRLCQQHAGRVRREVLVHVTDVVDRQRRREPGSQGGADVALHRRQ
eukprot:scaffold1300_cov235-Pinguiococcus_pyrenoidosus.AAC.2